jgi:hypothetical protein
VEEVLEDPSASTGAKVVPKSPKDLSWRDSRLTLRLWRADEAPAAKRPRMVLLNNTPSCGNGTTSKTERNEHVELQHQLWPAASTTL